MTSLSRVPVRRIIAAIADAAERWADADFPPRVRLLDRIIERTGYTVPVVEYALDQIFFSIARRPLEATIASELGSLDVLDSFIEQRDGIDVRALPAGPTCIISSRTTIGVAIVPAVFALCAKCDVLVKDREDGLVRAFFATLADELDEFATAAKAATWNGADDELDLQSFATIVAFGNDRTMTRIREHLAPDARFVGYGSKASIGYIGRDALTERGFRALADGAARDLVLYDSEGCLSLHALFIERDGEIDPVHAASEIAAAVERAAIEFPPGERDAASSARVSNARNLAAFRSASGTGAVFSDAQASFLAVLDPPLHDLPAFLPRTLGMHTVDAPDDALAYVQRHRLPIEAVAVAGSRGDIVNMAIDMGANRITTFGELQRPPLDERHGGRPRIAEFVRWITRER